MDSNWGSQSASIWSWLTKEGIYLTSIGVKWVYMSMEWCSDEEEEFTSLNFKRSAFYKLSRVSLINHPLLIDFKKAKQKEDFIYSLKIDAGASKLLLSYTAGFIPEGLHLWFMFESYSCLHPNSDCMFRLYAETWHVLTELDFWKELTKYLASTCARRLSSVALHWKSCLLKCFFLVWLKFGFVKTLIRTTLQR